MDHSEVKSVAAGELSQMIARKECVVIDIRDKASYQKCHIPGAASINTDEEVERFLAETDKEKAVVCCCYHGISSRTAAGYLQSRGFRNVYNLEGGFEGWKIFQKAGA